MMKVDLITKTNAITVLNAFFPKENWHDLIEDHLDVSTVEGMDLLLKEDLIEFVVTNTQALIEPVHTRVFCSGLIMGIEAESNRLFYAEVDQVLKQLDAGVGGTPFTTVTQTNATEVAA